MLETVIKVEVLPTPMSYSIEKNKVVHVIVQQDATWLQVKLSLAANKAESIGLTWLDEARFERIISNSITLKYKAGLFEDGYKFKNFEFPCD